MDHKWKGEAETFVWRLSAQKQKNFASGMVSYECNKRRNAHECKAKVKVLAGEIVGQTNQHTHPSDNRLADVAKAKMGVKR